MANSFTLGGALGSALTSAKGMVKNISSPQNQTLNNIKTGVVSAVKNAPANIGSAVNTANNVYKSVTNPVGTTAGLINKATTPTVKPAVNTVQNTQGGITSSWQTPTNTSTNTPVKTAGVLPQKSTKPVDNFNYNADAGQTTGVVKSTTNVGADGSKQTTTYHPPTETKSTGTEKQGNNLPTTKTTPTEITSENAYPETVTQLARMGQQPTQDFSAQREEANRINQQIEDAKVEMAKQRQGINTSGTWTSRALGEQGQADIANAATLSALGSQYQAAAGLLPSLTSQQSTQQNALGTAAGLAAPKSVSPSDTLVSPTNMQSQYGLGTGQGGNGADAYMNWQKLQKSTGQAGSISDTITSLQIPMQSMEKLVPQMESFMERANLNPASSAWVNKQTMTYLSKVGGSGLASQWSNMVGELQSYTNAILSTAGFTPTQSGEIVNAITPNNLSPEEFKGVMEVVYGLAQNKLYGMQNVKGQIESNPMNFYQGADANIQGQFNPLERAPISVINPTHDPNIQAGLTTASEVVQPAAAVGAFAKLGSMLLTKKPQ